MRFQVEAKRSEAIRISLIDEDNKEKGHAFLFLIKNDLHQKPYSLLEDVFVEENFRGQGIGKQLVEKAIQEAKNKGCYKIIGTSRNAREKVHKFYKHLGFDQYGVEFRMNL